MMGYISVKCNKWDLPTCITEKDVKNVEGGNEVAEWYILIPWHFCIFELKFASQSSVLYISNRYIYVCMLFLRWIGRIQTKLLIVVSCEELKREGDKCWGWGLDWGLVKGDLLFICKHPISLKNKRLQVNIYIKILGSSGLWYIAILSYFLYFSVFLNFLRINKNGVRMGT